MEFRARAAGGWGAGGREAGRARVVWRGVSGGWAGGHLCGAQAGSGLLRPQHVLYFLPDPQGHGSLRPTLFAGVEKDDRGVWRSGVGASLAKRHSLSVTTHGEGGGGGGGGGGRGGGWGGGVGGLWGADPRLCAVGNRG